MSTRIMTRKNCIQESSPRRTQGGAALVIGLLLLLVLTLLAISGMNTASLELVMAGNTQYQQNAFQAAESGIEQALRTDDFNPGALPQKTPSPVLVTGSDMDKYSTVTTAQLSGKAQPALWGSSWDSFSTYHFEIASQGVSARSAIATNFQGVAILSPADSTVPPGAGLPSTVLE